MVTSEGSTASKSTESSSPTKGSPSTVGVDPPVNESVGTAVVAALTIPAEVVYPFFDPTTVTVRVDPASAVVTV